MKNSQLLADLAKALEEKENLEAQLKIAQNAATIAMRETENLRLECANQNQAVVFVAKLYRQLSDSPRSFLSKMGENIEELEKIAQRK